MLLLNNGIAFKDEERSFIITDLIVNDYEDVKCYLLEDCNSISPWVIQTNYDIRRVRKYTTELIEVPHDPV